MEDVKQELKESILSARNKNQEKMKKEQDQKQFESQDQTVVHYPKAGFDTILDMEGEDLIFSDEAFATLPDFRCLSSPSSSPSPSPVPHLTKNVPASTVAPSCPSSSSSSSSPSSSWPFLRAPDGITGSGPRCSTEATTHGQQPSSDQAPELQLDLDLLGDVDLFDLSVPWDPSTLFPDHIAMDEPSACTARPLNVELSCPNFDQTNSSGATQGGDKEEDEDLGNFFLEWLKSNKDAISPEDLRTIRLKKSTIDTAARRLGGGRNARMQLLKLILAWVQNHHLQKKRKREAEESCMAASPNQLPIFNQTPNNPDLNPNVEVDLGGAVNLCNSWFPTSDLYNFPQSCSTSSVVVNSQPISPVSDFHATDPSLSWTQNYNNTPFQGYSSLTCSAGLQPTQYSTTKPISTLYHHHQQQQMAGIASATREARKKRMARQRRISSLHQNRALTHNSNQVHCGSVGHTANSNRNFNFWSSYSSNSQQGKGMMDVCLPPDGTNAPASQMKQTTQGSSQQERNMFRPGVSALERQHMQVRSYQSSCSTYI